MNAPIWRESADPRLQVCKFEHDGRRYMLHRDAAGKIVGVGKQERTNRYGVGWATLNVKGAAARKVLAAFNSLSEG